MPKEAACNYFSTPDGKWRFGSNANLPMDEDGINAHYARGTDRLNAMGVGYVRLNREGQPDNSGTSTDRGKKL